MWIVYKPYIEIIAIISYETNIQTHLALNPGSVCRVQIVDLIKNLTDNVFDIE